MDAPAFLPRVRLLVGDLVEAREAVLQPRGIAALLARVPKIFAVSLLEEPIELAEQLKAGRMDPGWLKQVRDMCALLYPAGLNIDYYPTNFVPQGGTLYYIDYECSAYMEQWDFEHWGVQYWAVPTSEG